MIFQKADFSVIADTGEFSGYASKYNGVDSYGDTILPGAYDEVLASGVLPKLFFNHLTREVPLGDYIEMEGRPDGLYVKGRLDLSIEKAREVYHGMKTGRIDGLSVGMEIPEDGYDLKDPDDWWSGYNISKVANLREISICTFPADGKARISEVKAEINEDELKERLQTVRDIESFLRDAGGFSKRQAGLIVALSRKVYERDYEQKLRRDAGERKLAELKAQIDGITRKLHHGY